MEIVRTAAVLRRVHSAWREAGQTVALVPTMGALHEGHLTLMRTARAACDRVIVSLFVNPAQFGPNEDFGRYPRDEAADARLIEAEGADLLYAPAVEEIYPDGFATTVTVSGPANGLCGDHRPGHFQGVATVVAKLLIQAQADRAFFGEKDYQQLLVVRRLARDLDLATVIEGVTTVREPDGLALSSRNAYLTQTQRAVAPLLHRTLTEMARRLADGGMEAASAIDWGIAELVEAGFDRLDYLEVRDAETLERIDRVTRLARVLVAAHLGGTRLIDNLPIIPA